VVSPQPDARVRPVLQAPPDEYYRAFSLLRVGGVGGVAPAVAAIVVTTVSNTAAAVNGGIVAVVLVVVAAAGARA